MVYKLTNESNNRRRKLRESDELNLTKTTVTTARKLFDSGETVYLLPNKVRLDNVWIKPFAVSRGTSGGSSFENIINSYSYYNCNNETGKGIAYYKKG